MKTNKRKFNRKIRHRSRKILQRGGLNFPRMKSTINKLHPHIRELLNPQLKNKQHLTDANGKIHNSQILLHQLINHYGQVGDINEKIKEQNNLRDEYLTGKNGVIGRFVIQFPSSKYAKDGITFYYKIPSYEPQ
jgi:hypothetical protein